MILQILLLVIWIAASAFAMWGHSDYFREYNIIETILLNLIFIITGPILTLSCFIELLLNYFLVDENKNENKGGGDS